MVAIIIVDGKGLTVECNATTGRVAKLDLSFKRGLYEGSWYLNFSDFQVFEDLKTFEIRGLKTFELRGRSVQILK